MFYGCTSLTTLPSNLLPATTLASRCYEEMFNGCTSLTTVPELPAPTLVERCYYSMFNRCTSLTTLPSNLLPATTLANYCYYSMFQGCTSLTTIPSDLLPATTLAKECYRTMFYGCRSLISVPADLLPATVLAEGCYSGMFSACTALTNSPDLPATTLAVGCYDTMFYACRLSSLPDLSVTNLVDRCYRQMFSNNTSIKVSATQTSDYQIPYRIPSSGTGTDATDALLNMFINTGGTFTGTPAINTTYYLYGQLPVPSYLTFRSPSSFTLKTNSETTSWDGTLEYSTDSSTWSTWDGTEISSGLVNGNNDLYLRGTGNTKITVPNNSKNFVFTGLGISIIGNIENLLDYQTVLSGNHPSMANNCYMCMFWECTELISISLDLLPATTLTNSCYSGMFWQCTSLTNVPRLPATTLAESCYTNMFGGGCTSLNTLPRLAAVTLEHSCYSSMFANSTSLKLSETQVDDYQIPYRIPAEGEGTSATNATLFMFAGTGGTFKGISVTLNKTYYTSNQVV